MTKSQKKLAEFMSELSEEAFSAGWMRDLEYELWKIIKGKSIEYGRLVITEEKITRLKHLSKVAGGWVVFEDQDSEERFVRIEEWRRMINMR